MDSPSGLPQTTPPGHSREHHKPWAACSGSDDLLKIVDWWDFIFMQSRFIGKHDGDFLLSVRDDSGHRGWSDNPWPALRPSYKAQPNALNPHVCYL